MNDQTIRNCHKYLLYSLACASRNLTDFWALAAGRRFVLKLAQRCDTSTASVHEVDTFVGTKVHHLDAETHEVNFHDLQVIVVEQKLLEIEIVAEQAALELHDVVVVGNELLQVGQIHECVFIDGDDFVSAHIDNLQVFGVLENARRQLFDLVLGQVKFLQLFHVAKIAEFNQTQV